MRCSECEHDYPGDDEPNFCPDCGAEFREKTAADVDWPVSFTVAPRINVFDYVLEQTGVENTDALWDMPTDYELIVEFTVHQDGTVEVGDEL